MSKCLTCVDEGAMECGVLFTTEEDFGNMAVPDDACELVGYVDQIEASSTVGKGTTKYRLFKFILTNGVQRIACLVWNDLIDNYEKLITPNLIIELKAARIKPAKGNQSTSLERNEIVVHPHTIVIFHGTRATRVQANLQPVRIVSFENIALMTGQISLTGFLRTQFVSVRNVFNNTSSGLASITNSVVKVNINVSRFSTTIKDLEEGHQITVIGKLRENKELPGTLDVPITIDCLSMDDITFNKDVPKMDKALLRRGVASPE